jgi:hypothetical protein
MTNTPDSPPHAPPGPSEPEPELAVLRPLVRRAIRAAGLADLAERVLRGQALGEPERARLRAADLLALAALADAVRARAAGDDVWLDDADRGGPAATREAAEATGSASGAAQAAGSAGAAPAGARASQVSTLPGGRPVRWLSPALGGAEGATGIEALREVAVARLCTPHDVSLGVSWDAVGMELAQVALLFGADVLGGVLRRKAGLPVVEAGARAARRDEIAALVARAGRTPRWVEAAAGPTAGAAERAGTGPSGEAGRGPRGVRAEADDAARAEGLR